MEAKLRKEIVQSMCVFERLSGYTRLNNGSQSVEGNAVLSYAEDRERDFVKSWQPPCE